MKQQINKKGIQFVNESLPENVCVMIYGLTVFPMFLEKLNDLWTGVILPKGYEEDDVLPWCMAYLKYEKHNKDCYLIWFFDNVNFPISKVVDDSLFIKEIKQFLKDEESNKE